MIDYRKILQLSAEGYGDCCIIETEEVADQSGGDCSSKLEVISAPNWR